MNHVYAQMKEVPGETTVIEVENKRGVNVNGGARGLSGDGLNALRDGVLVWVASRIARRLAEGKSAPKVRVTVTVEFPDD